MLKISFKDKIGSPSKIVQREGDVTYVTLVGYTNIPFKLDNFTAVEKVQKIYGVEIEWMHDNALHFFAKLKVTGKTKKSPNDKEDSLLGERIAESRAKLKLYKFALHLLKSAVQNASIFIWGDRISYVEKYTDDKYANGSAGQSFLKYAKLIMVEEKHLKKLLSNDPYNKSTN